MSSINLHSCTGGPLRSADAAVWACDSVKSCSRLPPEPQCGLDSPVDWSSRYVFCRQRQDDSLRRGADQHSLVLLSEHPYSSVLVPLCQWAGPFYFNHGQIALEEVLLPTPAPGSQDLLDFGVGQCLQQVLYSRRIGVLGHQLAQPADPATAGGLKLLCAQLYMDVLAWDPPSSAYRGTVTIGGVRHQSQVRPGTLPDLECALMGCNASTPRPAPETLYPACSLW